MNLNIPNSDLPKILETLSYSTSAIPLNEADLHLSETADTNTTLFAKFIINIINLSRKTEIESTEIIAKQFSVLVKDFEKGINTYFDNNSLATYYEKTLTTILNDIADIANRSGSSINIDEIKQSLIDVLKEIKEKSDKEQAEEFKQLLENVKTDMIETISDSIEDNTKNLESTVLEIAKSEIEKNKNDISQQLSGTIKSLLCSNIQVYVKTFSDKFDKTFSSYITNVVAEEDKREKKIERLNKTAAIIFAPVRAIRKGIDKIRTSKDNLSMAIRDNILDHLSRTKARMKTKFTDMGENIRKRVLRATRFIRRPKKVIGLKLARLKKKFEQEDTYLGSIKKYGIYGPFIKMISDAWRRRSVKAMKLGQMNFKPFAFKSVLSNTIDDFIQSLSDHASIIKNNLDIWFADNVVEGYGRKKLGLFRWFKKKKKGEGEEEEESGPGLFTSLLLGLAGRFIRKKIGSALKMAFQGLRRILTKMVDRVSHGIARGVGKLLVKIGRGLNITPLTKLGGRILKYGRYGNRIPKLYKMIKQVDDYIKLANKARLAGKFDEAAEYLAKARSLYKDIKALTPDNLKGGIKIIKNLERLLKDIDNSDELLKVARKAKWKWIKELLFGKSDEAADAAKAGAKAATEAGEHADDVGKLRKFWRSIFKKTAQETASEASNVAPKAASPAVEVASTLMGKPAAEAGEAAADAGTKVASKAIPQAAEAAGEGAAKAVKLTEEATTQAAHAVNVGADVASTASKLGVEGVENSGEIFGVFGDIKPAELEKIAESIGSNAGKVDDAVDAVRAAGAAVDVATESFSIGSKVVRKAAGAGFPFVDFIGDAAGGAAEIWAPHYVGAMFGEEIDVNETVGNFLQQNKEEVAENEALAKGSIMFGAMIAGGDSVLDDEGILGNTFSWANLGLNTWKWMKVGGTIGLAIDGGSLGATLGLGTVIGTTVGAVIGVATALVGQKRIARWTYQAGKWWNGLSEPAKTLSVSMVGTLFPAVPMIYYGKKLWDTVSGWFSSDEEEEEETPPPVPPEIAAPPPQEITTPPSVFREPNFEYESSLFEPPKSEPIELPGWVTEEQLAKYGENSIFLPGGVVVSHEQGIVDVLPTDSLDLSLTADTLGLERPQEFKQAIYDMVQQLDRGNQLAIMDATNDRLTQATFQFNNLYGATNIEAGIVTSGDNLPDNAESVGYYGMCEVNAETGSKLVKLLWDLGPEFKYAVLPANYYGIRNFYDKSMNEASTAADCWEYIDQNGVPHFKQPEYGEHYKVKYKEQPYDPNATVIQTLTPKPLFQQSTPVVQLQPAPGY